MVAAWRIDYIRFILFVRLFREEERDGKAQAPVRAAAGFLGVIPTAERQLDGLLAHLEELADARVQGHGPLSVYPVVGGLGVEAEGRLLLCGEGDERLATGFWSFLASSAASAFSASS